MGSDDVRESALLSREREFVGPLRMHEVGPLAVEHPEQVLPLVGPEIVRPAHPVERARHTDPEIGPFHDHLVLDARIQAYDEQAGTSAQKLPGEQIDGNASGTAWKSLSPRAGVEQFSKLVEVQRAEHPDGVRHDLASPLPLCIRPALLAVPRSLPARALGRDPPAMVTVRERHDLHNLGEWDPTTHPGEMGPPVRSRRRAVACLDRSERAKRFS